MITIPRLPGWRARLAQVMTANPGRPFDWQGGGDCFLGHVAPAVEAMLGQDIAAPFRGRYDSAETARAELTRDGYATLADFMAALFPEIAPARAHIGDIAAIPVADDPLGFSLGIVTGERIHVLGLKGHGTVKLTRATRAFLVGT